MRYARRIALVTGAGSGIGRAISVRLGAEGAYVHALDLHLQSARETSVMIREHGGLSEPVECDVSETESVARALSRVPRLDVLVNCAGIAHVGTVEQTTADDMDRLYRVNVRGVFNGLHFGVPLLRRAGGGAILNLASIASKIGIAERFAYSMTKGAVMAMTLSVARDYVRERIRCNCLCPARIHTPFVDGYLEKNHPNSREQKFRELSEFQPVGRMGTPEEVAGLAVFLCSNEADFITGASYDIDGGAVSLR